MLKLATVVLSIVAITAACAQSPSTTGAVVIRGAEGALADSALKSLEGQGFSGVVLLARNGEVVLSKGYGSANRGSHTPMSPGTLVQIGSNTKDFTIVSILQLYERGKLGLQDSITKYFQGVPPDKRGITIWQLVMHRAGFPMGLGGDFDAVTRDQLIARAMAAPLLFHPGDSVSYSNTGYSLLGAIIEKVSGKSYDEYVRDNILTPLDLNDTGFLLPDFDVRRLAHGYRGAEDYGTILEKAHAPDGPYWNLRANGGMMSTVTDMFRFYRALFNTEKLVRAETRDLRFGAREARMLAGSDRVSFFLYNREPASGVELLIATNSSEFLAPRARAALASSLGLGATAGGPIVTRGNPAAGGPQTTMSIDTAPRRRAPSQSAAQSKAVRLPDTPAGRAAAAYFRAFNTGDPERMRKFIQESTAPNPSDSRTIDDRVAAHQGMYGRRGSLIPVVIENSSPSELTLQVRSAKMGTAMMIFNVEPAAPNRLISVRIMDQ